MFICSHILVKLLHSQSKTTHINTLNNKQQLGDNINTNINKKHKYMISQPEPEKYLFAVGSWAGYPVFLCCYVFFSKLFCFMYVVVYVVLFVFA